ncbi:MAG: transposase family protein [Anaerolineae bacterium]|nr:transposase family protein [Anaerolineae bacterium]
MNNEVIATIKEHFGQVRDPRQPGKVEHPLINIIFITICGVLCGANNWVAIEDFGNAQKEWLEQYLNLEKGIVKANIFYSII